MQALSIASSYASEFKYKKCRCLHNEAYIVFYLSRQLLTNSDFKNVWWYPSIFLRSCLVKQVANFLRKSGAQARQAHSLIAAYASEYKDSLHLANHVYNTFSLSRELSASFSFRSVLQVRLVGKFCYRAALQRQLSPCNCLCKS